MSATHNTPLFIFVLALTVLVVSCAAPKKVIYLQDVQPEVPVAVQAPEPIRLEPGDKISIKVHSRDRELAQMFNLTDPSSATGGGTNNYSLYTLDEYGRIDMPILGLIDVEGLTRLEVANLIKYRLLAGTLLRDPIVTVEYANLSFFVLGEVGSPGEHEIDRDDLTIIEALSKAGDLTIQGKREDILVLRTEGNRQVPYRVDLTSMQSVYSSPVYYVKQNDVIIVEPTQYRANQQDINANTTRTPSFWMSAISFIMTLALFFVR